MYERYHLFTLLRRILRGVFAAFPLMGTVVYSQAPTVSETNQQTRIYHILRYDDDWIFLRDKNQRRDWLDPIKLILMSKTNTHSYLSFGGEFRQSAENIHDDDWRILAPKVNTFSLQRFQLHVDAHFNPQVRLFLQFESGLEEGRNGGPRPIDLKRLDFLNAFVELRLNHSSAAPYLRVGRQEVQLGSGRMVAVREGPNVRQSFYGFRLSAPIGQWHTDLIALRPAADKPGFFDNVPLQTTSFYGAYLTRPWHAASLNQFDFYYLSLDRRHAVFNRGTGRELRETLGVRIASHDPAEAGDRTLIPHFDLESNWQFGSFASSRIQAWTAAVEVGAIFPAIPLKPRVGLRSNITSGDRNLTSGALGTFNPLFPIGNYFGILTDTGPGPLNSRDLHPNVRVFIPHGIAIDADWLFWWRQSTQDGVYGVPGNLLIPSGKSNARFVGHRPGIEAKWQIDRHAYLQADYGVFFAGAFPHESGDKGNLNYASVWLGYKF